MKKKTRNRLLILTIVVAVIAAIIAGLANFYTEYLWFSHLGFSSVYVTVLVAQVGTGVGFGLVCFVMLMLHIMLVRKYSKPRDDWSISTAAGDEIDLRDIVRKVSTPVVVAAALVEPRPAAILVEPVQGRGGCRAAPPGWLAMLRRLCDGAGVLLIFDEIFTGFGRAGERVLSGTPAGDHVVPDLLCLGKGLTSGFPLSACIGSEAVMAAWGHSRGEALHTSTFLGHPVGCAAALAVIELLEGGLLERGRELGAHMADTLGALASRHPDRLGGVRGRGAMRGLEVREGAAMTLCRGLLQRGYLVLPAGLDGEVISFTPPLVMTRAQWDGAIAALEAEL